MKLIGHTGRDEVAMVYLAELGEGRLIEFVESVQPPLAREKKWVLMVSTLFGCPVQCLMCDAGSFYRGKLTAEEMLAQIDFLVDKRFPGRVISSDNFKIQFARMGEPALNPAVLDVLKVLPDRYQAPGLMPSFSTIAPIGCGDFFEELIRIKDTLYPAGRFQFQFSVHTTDETLRDRLIPAKKWNFQEMAEFGDRFYQAGDRKITLNFSLAKGVPVDPALLLRFFNPKRYLIKITPVNPTYKASNSGLISYIDPFDLDRDYRVVRELEEANYQVIVSVGEREENRIGSNCGQYVMTHLREKGKIAEGYHFDVVTEQGERLRRNA
ncbi:MAG: hypothetical protein QMD32_01805 [Smithellaceae bacterium]|nr:hypothetical protein [Smithellaceae bacterium]